MPENRKLGRPTQQRLSMLKGLVTSLIQNGKIETTQAKAKEVKQIVDSLIHDAVVNADQFTVKTETFSRAKVDGKGRKVTKTVTSKNGNKYEKVERETYTQEIRTDSPSRLSARKKAINWLYRVKDDSGNNINLSDKLFDEIAPKYKDRNGGYTRITKLGARRGDSADMVILELI